MRDICAQFLVYLSWNMCISTLENMIYDENFSLLNILLMTCRVTIKLIIAHDDSNTCSVLVCTNITLTIKWWKQKWRLGLNDNAACNLNRIQMNGVQIESNWIELNLNALDGIQIHWNWSQFQKHCIDIKFNWREMRCKLIQKVLKVCLSFLSFVYGVVEKILGSKNTQIWQDTLSFHSYQISNQNLL
jgi:hypothetical protein